MTIKEWSLPWETRQAFRGLSPNWEIQDMTSLAEAESKYGHVVQNAGGQIFGIERATSVGRQEEKLKIGTPDGFVKIAGQKNLWATSRFWQFAKCMIQGGF